MSRKKLLAAGLTGLLAAAAMFGVGAQTGTADDTPTYLGAKSCMKCHMKQYKAWKKTGLESSLDSLKPTPESDKALFDRKKAAGLDPAKDFTTDAKCLACHTTGYGKAGGYPVDPAASDEAKDCAKVNGNVGCESCHGPGSKYVEFKTEKTKADPNAKFTFDELGKFGLVKPDETTCKTCHNEQNPTHKSDPFEFSKSKDLVHPVK